MNKFVPLLALLALGTTTQAAQLTFHSELSNPGAITPGSEFSVNIFVDADNTIRELVGGKLRIQYETNLLTASDARVATEFTIPQGPWETDFSSTTSDTATGEIDMTFGAFGAPEGNQTLLIGTIDFIAENVGSSSLRFSAADGNGSFVGLDNGGIATPFNDAAFENQPIAVSAVPIPAAIWLFGSAVFGLGIVGNKRNQQKA